MRKFFSLHRFAKFMGYKSARNKEFRSLLSSLVDSKVVEVQQGGFLSDSQHHSKLIVVRKEERIEELKGLHPLETLDLETSRKTKVHKEKHRVRVVKEIIVRNVHWVTKRIGVTVLMRASGGKGKNSGIYLYIPKDHVEAYGIKPGHKVEAKLLRVFHEGENVGA